MSDAQARLEAWLYNYAGDLANVLSESGKQAEARGQTEEALNDLQQAISLFRELDRPEQELALWLEVGRLERQAQRRDAAADALETALRLARRIEDDESAAQALYQLGLLDTDAGEWRRALLSFQQARSNLKPDAALYRKVVSDEMDAHQHLGDLEHSSGELAGAYDAYRNAAIAGTRGGRCAAHGNLVGKNRRPRRDARRMAECGRRVPAGADPNRANCSTCVAAGAWTRRQMHTSR